MEKPFVPANFIIPLRLETPHFILRKLTTADVEQDYEAVMSSKENLRQIFSAQDEWPRDEMTMQDNFKDLKEHQEDFDQRRGFTYTVVSPSEDTCLGCVYFYPWMGAQYDAQVYYWVRDAAKSNDLEKQLDHFLHQWLAETWPFRAPAFPGREVAWDIWEGLRQAKED
jgi:RimJ/RimL family protein N-acetyltransferase